MRTKTLWIKDEYIQEILSGRKTVEVRAAYSNLLRLEAGDLLMLNNAHLYRITRITRYRSISELLAGEEAGQIAPGVPPAELPGLIRAIYPLEKEALGLLAIEIQPAKPPLENGAT